MHREIWAGYVAQLSGGLTRLPERLKNEKGSGSGHMALWGNDEIHS